MSTGTPKPVANNNEIILERVGNIQTTMVDIKDSLRTLTDSFRTFQLEYTKSHADVVNKADAAHKHLADHDKEIDAINIRIEKLAENLEKLENVISPLVTVNRVLIFFAGILGAAVLAFIGALLTHQIGVVLHP